MTRGRHCGYWAIVLVAGFSIGVSASSPAPRNIRGIVVDPQGNPVAGAHVGWHKAGHHEILTVAGVSDARGRFDLGPLVEPIAVIANPPDFAESAVEWFVKNIPDEGRLVLRRPGRVLGCVITRRPGASAVRVGLDDYLDNKWPRAPVPVASDGSFAIDRVAPGRIYVVMKLEDGQGRWVQDLVAREELSEGETKAIDVVIANVRLRGRVTVGGRGAAEHGVSLHGGPLMMARTDGEGWYELLVPVVGSYSLSVGGPAFRTYPPPRRNVDIPDVDVYRVDFYLP
jgi:hypothetical protein